jgi:hypothetical protein
MSRSGKGGGNDLWAMGKGRRDVVDGDREVRPRGCSTLDDPVKG